MSRQRGRFDRAREIATRLSWRQPALHVIPRPSGLGSMLAEAPRMSWQRRLVELMAAGGALASLSGCPAILGCGNANPDPCICNRMPATSPQCVAEKTCEDNGGQWSLFSELPPIDAGSGSGSIEGQCIGYPHDAPRPVDGSIPDAAVDGAPRD